MARFLLQLGCPTTLALFLVFNFKKLNEPFDHMFGLKWLYMSNGSK